MKLITSEAVSIGHPDKVADQISDAMLDECLRQDSNSRVAVETMVTTNTVFLAGEVTTHADVDVDRLVRGVVKDIGYDFNGFDYNNLTISRHIHRQSPDIAMGVDRDGAGDQGMMFGYAEGDASTNYLPVPIYYAQALMLEFQRRRQYTDKWAMENLRPDAKCQITYDEDSGKIRTIVISHQHVDSMYFGDFINHARMAIRMAIPENLILPLEFLNHDDEYSLVEDKTFVFLNPTGRFVEGGPSSDTGLCLNENTLVYTPSGLIKIKNLRIGSKVYTENGGKAVIVEHVNNGERETRIITDERGISIEATLNHPFRVWNGKEIIWKECGQLEVGDVLIKRNIQNLVSDDKYNRKFSFRKKGTDIEVKFDENLAYLLGWLVGDGNTTRRDAVTFYYGNEEEKCHLKEKLLCVFPEEEIKHYDCQDDRFMILSIPFVEALKKIGVSATKSFEKEVPECILRSTDIRKASFLAGLFDADGHISKGGRNNDYYNIQLATVSKNLAQQVSIMLQSMGIQSTIDYNKCNKNTHVTSKGNTIQSKHDRYDVRICGLKSIHKFLYDIGFKLSYKNMRYLDNKFPKKYQYNDCKNYYFANPMRELLKMDARKSYKYFENYDSVSSQKSDRAYKYENVDYVLDMFAEYRKCEAYQTMKNIFDNFEMVKIKEIESSKSLTYDISLNDNTHSFIANSFVVHNTGRKIVVDTYGGVGKVGGGAFSGKDPSKVDRSAAYMCRYVAKNLVASGKCRKAEVSVAYAIGVAEPVQVSVNTFGTGNDAELTEYVRQKYDFKPKAIIERFGLRNPQGWCYRGTARNGHFTNCSFPWEKIEK